MVTKLVGGRANIFDYCYNFPVSATPSNYFLKNIYTSAPLAHMITIQTHQYLKALECLEQVSQLIFRHSLPYTLCSCWTEQKDLGHAGSLLSPITLFLHFSIVCAIHSRSECFTMKLKISSSMKPSLSLSSICRVSCSALHVSITVYSCIWHIIYCKVTEFNYWLVYLPY